MIRQTLPAISMSAVPALLISLVASCAPPFLFANAGVSLAEAGSSAFVEGELRSARKVTLETADRAFTLALENLQFPVERRAEGDGFVYLTADQYGDDNIQIRLTSRSPAVTSIKIRVGVFGNLAISRLVMEEALDVLRQLESRDGEQVPSPSNDAESHPDQATPDHAAPSPAA